ncbi:MAG: hypothetical protein QXF24_08410 [Thermoproteota archaeon]
MRNGAQLEYAGDVYFVDFYTFDKSMIPVQLLNISGVRVQGGNSSMVSLLFEESVGYRLSVALKEVNGSIGLFEVTLEIGPYTSTRDLRVDLSTRQTMSFDGAPLGQTTIWIQPCEKGDIIPYVGQGNSTVFADVSRLSIPMETPQGLQDVLKLDTIESQSIGYEGINLSTKITPVEAQSTKHYHPRSNFYDADTFILVKGAIYEDAFISAFGIIGSGFVKIELVSTNINLGSPNLLFELLQLSPYIGLVAIAAVTFTYFFFTKRRNR